MEFIIEAATDIGIVKKINQDSYHMKVLQTPIGKIAFAIVCDGMGGLSYGEIASATIVNAFVSWLMTDFRRICSNEVKDSDIRTAWTNIVTQYNDKIKDYGRQNGCNIGTTVTAMLVTEQRYFIINVGDTRAYQIKKKLDLITEDQTVIQREIKLGNLTEEQAKTDPRRSVLLQCIGASNEVNPDFYFGKTEKNTVYMICSDGFRHEISEREIVDYLNPSVLKDKTTIHTKISDLINLNKQRQERDNITAVVIQTI